MVFFTLNSNYIYRETLKLNPYKLQISYCVVTLESIFLETIQASVEQFESMAREIDITSLYSFMRLLPLQRSDLSKFSTHQQLEANLLLSLF
jgi:hypothetical protein